MYPSCHLPSDWQSTHLGGQRTSSRNSSILLTSVLTSPLKVMKGGCVPGARFWRSAGFLEKRGSSSSALTQTEPSIQPKMNVCGSNQNIFYCPHMRIKDTKVPIQTNFNIGFKAIQPSPSLTKLQVLRAVTLTMWVCLHYGVCVCVYPLCFKPAHVVPDVSGKQMTHTHTHTHTKWACAEWAIWIQQPRHWKPFSGWRQQHRRLNNCWKPVTVV